MLSTAVHSVVRVLSSTARQVDCPGHASLIRTVIGGAQIIDMIILVIDATKGMQAQTVECVVIGEAVMARGADVIVVLNKVRAAGIYNIYGRVLHRRRWFAMYFEVAYPALTTLPTCDVVLVAVPATWLPCACFEC